MKHWLGLGIVAMSMAAAADPAMVAEKGLRGKVVLTAEKHEACSGSERIAYLTRLVDPSGPADTITYWGCWIAARDEVRVHYFIGTNTSYRRTEFSYDDVPRIPIPHRGAPHLEDRSKPDSTFL